MYSAIDQDEILYTRIAASPLAAAISGKVYRYQRPVDSNKEDIVINTITIDGEMIQRGVSNVNIHVPSIEVSTGLMQPNLTRFKTLLSLAKPVLEKGFGEKYNFWLLGESLVQEPGKDIWFYNLRIQFKLHNTTIP